MRRAREAIAIALDMAERSGDRAVQAFASLMAASIEFYASRWRKTVELCARAEEIVRSGQSRSEWDLMTSHTLSLAALAYAGELRALRTRQHELVTEARRRGNALSAQCLSSGPANIGWLVADDADEAERRANEALAPWKRNAFQLAHYFHLVATVQIALYRGDARGAWRRLSREWPKIVASMNLQVQNFRVTLRHLRARCAIALAAESGGGRLGRTERARLVRLARREAGRLAREDVAWCAPLAASLEAGVAALSGDSARASLRLEAAARGYRGLDMQLHAAAADYLRGSLLGGETGRALLRRAEAWMIGEDVVRPERIAAMIIPPAR
jgi:hypothetical protein